jgi:DNA polymerase III epsilon subunit-like protein
MSLNSIICIDFETGGLDPSKNPALEIAYQAFELDTYKPILEFTSFIIPYDNLVMEDSAMENHGITALQYMNGLETRELVKKIQDDFTKVNTGNYRSKPILMGHNIGFDIGFLLYLFNKHKGDIGKYVNCNKNHLGYDVPVSIDTITLAKQKWGNDPTVTKYNLGACVAKAGIDHFDAHRAMNDVSVTKELFLYFTNHLRSGENKSEESQSIRYRNNFKF